MLSSAIQCNASGALRLQKEMTSRAKRARGAAISQMLLWEIDLDHSHDVVDFTSREIESVRNFIAVHRQKPHLIMALTADNATLQSIVECAKADAHLVETLGYIPTMNGIISLNRQYFTGCTPRPSTRLRPTLLALQSITNACSADPLSLAFEKGEEEEDDDGEEDDEEEADAEEGENDEAPPTMMEAEQDADVEEAVVTKMAIPADEPFYHQKSSVTRLNKVLKKLMVQRKKDFSHRGRWCCIQQLDVPYFATRIGNDGMELYLQHSDVWKSHMCWLCRASNSNVQMVDKAQIN